MRIENRKLKRQYAAHMPKSPDGDIIRIKTERKGIGKMKGMLILLVALLQLGLLVFLHLQLVNAFRWYLIFSVVMDIVTCLYLLGSSKNGRAKAVWIMLILVLFPVGFLIFFLSDERIFFRSSRKRYKKILIASSDLPLKKWEGDMPKLTALACAYIKNTTEYMPVKNTAAKYYPSGASAFDDMLADCASAQRFIFIEYFIIAEGALFSRLFGVLKERAAAGVDVRIIYDDMGSSGRLPRSLKKQVRAAGIQMYTFNKLVPLYRIGMNYRDHRKITVVDGRIAYTGGINVADEYVNEKRLYGYWKDNAVRMEGDAAQGFTLMFLRQWEFVTRKRFDYLPFLQSAEEGVSSAEQHTAEGLEKLPDSAEDLPDYLESAAEKTFINAEATCKTQSDGVENLPEPCTEELPEGAESAAEPCIETLPDIAENLSDRLKNPPAVCAESSPDSAEDLPAAETSLKSTEQESGIFLPYASGLEYRDPVVRDVYAGVLSQARERLWIMTPYFVPDETITNMLTSKARSGVDVRIVLPGVPDKAYVYLISLDNADKLTRSGVKVYTMSDAFVHTKSVLTENCAVIGSANFDLRSFFQQYENAVYTDDKTVMRGLEADFEATFPECVQRNYVNGKTRPLRTLLTAILQIFAPMM